MLEAVRFREGVNLLGQWVWVIAAMNQEFLQSGEGLARFQAGDGVNLDSVAGGENDGLVGNARFAQALKRGGNAPFGKGESFTQGDRRSVMTQADDNERHS